MKKYSIALLSAFSLLFSTALLATPEKAQQTPLIIMDTEIPPGTATSLPWNSGQNFNSIDWNTPVIIKHGVNPGPVMCMTSTLHGDEINGIEVIRRVFKALNVNDMHGSIVAVPIVNLDGFLRSARYLSDRSDLNRFFPGAENGSTAQRVAYSLFNEIVTRCNVLLDLHTGSLHRSNVPQVRANLKLESIKEVIDGLSDLTIVHSEGNAGMLRNAANDIGIPAVTLEIGGPFLFDKKGVEEGTKSILNLISYLEITRKFSFLPQPKASFNISTWVNSDYAGIYMSDVHIGQNISKGDIIGRVADPISNKEDLIASPFDGKIIGLALDQFIHTGFAVAHIARKTDEKEIDSRPKPDESLPVPDIERDD